MSETLQVVCFTAAKPGWEGLVLLHALWAESAPLQSAAMNTLSLFSTSLERVWVFFFKLLELNTREGYTTWAALGAGCGTLHALGYRWALRTPKPASQG